MKKGKQERTPRYARIRDALRSNISENRIERGLVLLEGPIARLFGTSRGPVRKALEQMHEEGLISRFEGRGYVVSREGEAVKPIRARLTRRTLGLDAEDAAVDTRPAADRIYPDVAENVVTCIAFGHFRIIEAALSTHYGVSRTVAREVLGRLRSQRLVEKGQHSHWLAGPLTAHSVAEDYEIRALLEPAALRASAPKLDRNALSSMQERLEQLIRRPADRTPAAVRAVEHDLHSACLQHTRNTKAAEMIRQCQLPIMVNRIFFSTLGIAENEPLFLEHKRVIDHLVDGAYDAAASSLQTHLQAAAERTRRRLKVLSVFPEPELPPYLVRIS